MAPSTGLGKKPFEKIVGKGEIACIIFVTFNLSSANAFNLVWSKILSCGNGLTLYHTNPTFNDPV